MQSVSIVIPVYNAFDEAVRCLASVLEHGELAHRVLVVDDASPEGDFESYCRARLSPSKQIEFRRNEKNLGFVGSCNLGMRETSTDDVILLNSDTVVTQGWIAKLCQAAASSPKVGSVTPFTNNGTVCSLPRIGESNELPSGHTVDSFGALVERVSIREYPHLPTCVGFCVLFTRRALDAVGLFDEDAFGRGYGEENDLSCRMHKAGFIDILDDATFVYHKGSQSFGHTKSELAERNEKVLRSKHPHYYDRVARFFRENSLNGVRGRVLDELVREWMEREPRSVLHIVQNGPKIPRHHPLGGTELHVRDLIEKSQNVASWSLVPGKGCYFLTAHHPEFEREYIIRLGSAPLRAILRRNHFDLIHLHHSRFIDHFELTSALLSHGEYIISFHDYVLLCPRFHLLTPERRHCTGHECVQSCSLRAHYIAEYRARTDELLRGAKHLFCFSESTRSYVEKISGISGLPWTVAPHGILGALKPEERLVPPEPIVPSRSSPLKVAFVGSVPQHKGSLIIEQMLKRSDLGNGIGVEWHMLGKFYGVSDGKLVEHGEYRPEEFVSRLRGINPHLVVILSICPETYCLTLDESWNAGYPVVATPLGALPERVRRSGAGWVVQSLTPESVLDLLAAIASDWPGYQSTRGKIPHAAIRSIEDEVREYEGHYMRLAPKSEVSTVALLNFLKQFSLARVPQLSHLQRLGGHMVDSALYVVEHLRLRASVERLIYRAMPRRLIEQMKALRQGL